jgi:hypothetical protein
MTWATSLAWSQLVVFILVAAGLAFWLSRHIGANAAIGMWIVILIVAIAGVVLTSRRVVERRTEAEGIARRAPGPARPGSLDAPPHPYRARIARVAAAAVPTVSARTTALVVGAALIASAVLLPVSLKLPRWLEVEVVLGAWWAMLVVGLGVLLFRGTRFHEDHRFRIRFDLPELGGGLDVGDPGCSDIEGCAGIVIGVVLAVLAFVAAWIVIELLFPVVFFLLYWLVVKAIARVANDTHGCAGNLGCSLQWGVLWATVYTLPLALVVWGIHAIVPHH